MKNTPTPYGETESRISCKIRCMDPIVVEKAMGCLDPNAMQRVPYTCQISGESEELLLLGDLLANRLAESIAEAGDAAGARILAALYATALCECDVATLTGLPENEVVDRLKAFISLGVLEHQKIHGMNYFRLVSDDARRKIEALGASF